MPAFLYGAARWIFGLIIRNGNSFAKIISAVALLSSFLLLFNLVRDFFTTSYTRITGAAADFASVSLPSAMGCVMHNLGIDQTLTSGFAIFFSASIFWASSVLLIFLYRGAIKILKLKLLRR